MCLKDNWTSYNLLEQCIALQGVEMMKDYDWIEVPPFCRQEFNQCVDLYVKNGWITKGG